METRFNAGEIADIAVRVEQNGEVFYDRHAERTQDEEVARTFRNLADAERRHERIFRAMAEGFRRSGAEEYPGNDSLYFEAVANETIFTRGVIDASISGADWSVDKVLAFAADIEAASIAYYEKMLRFVSRRDGRSVKRIITEERAHLATVRELLARTRV